MQSRRDLGSMVSRRTVPTGSAAFLAGSAVGGAVAARADEGMPGPSPGAPPLPSPRTKLDPLQAGRRACRLYLDRGGCGTGSCLALLGLRKGKVGHPWTTLPDAMMTHAAAGYGGPGTLCGSHGGTSCIINLVAYDEKGEGLKRLITRLFWWCAAQEFPSNRFDDISALPQQVKAKAMSTLCRTSVSKWTLAAGEELTSLAKKERCAKVCGAVVYTVTRALNEYFDGTWTPPTRKPSECIRHCIACHRPDDMWQGNEGMNHQQGHMECLMYHEDQTK